MDIPIPDHVTTPYDYNAALGRPGREGSWQLPFQGDQFDTPEARTTAPVFGGDSGEEGFIRSPAFTGDAFIHPSQGFAGGGLVKKYADGGLAGLSNSAMMGQGMPGGIMPEQDTTDQDRQLVAMTVAAIKGQIPNAEEIIRLFVETFGEEALADLMARVQGGDGKSDSIPAQINTPQGPQPAQLSEGEYVLPAETVSQLGRGSTDAGARMLDGMIGKQAPMMPQQPKQPFQLMPG
jgi:hypothetical protein